MLKNKIVMITGASSGIGAACAAYFAKAQAKLLLCARNLEKLTKVADEIKQEYQVDTHYFELDVRHATQVKNACQNLPSQWKDIEILINNAGLAAGLDPLPEGNIEDWEIMLDTNVKGLLYVTREILPNMIAKNSGHIINIGSVAAHEIYPKGAVYCATKSAVLKIAQGLRMDLLGTNLRVSTISPGLVETNFSNVRFKGDTGRAANVYAGMQPLTAEDVADSVLYCASCPPHVNISEIIIMPTAQASATMVHRD